MRKSLLFIFILFCCHTGFSQAIYKGLEYGMTEKEAKKEFKENREDYITVDIGNGFQYRIYRQYFEFENNKLVGILLRPKGAALGQGYDGAVSYLEYSRRFFEDLGYTLFFEPKFWNGPQNFSSKYGLLMYNPEKTVMIQLYPTTISSGTFLVKLHLYNYKTFMGWYEKEANQYEKTVENSGF